MISQCIGRAVGEFGFDRKVNLSDHELIQIAFFFMLLQVADGVLTAMGIGMFGIHAEGNIFLKQLMGQYGFVETLVVTKVLCIVAILILTFLAYQIRWIKGAMGFVSFIYVFAAIIPWVYILSRALAV